LLQPQCAKQTVQGQTVQAQTVQAQTVQAQTSEPVGTIACFGIGSSVKGWRSNLNVLDDPLRDHEQASAIEQLDGQWNWYHSAYRTRRVPGAPQIVASTRWASFDIPGLRISATKKGKAAERWDLVRLPLCADADDDPLGRKQGEVLWQGHWTKDELALKRANPIQFATLEQQTGLNDEGSWLGDMDAILIEASASENFKYKLAIGMAWHGVAWRGVAREPWRPYSVRRLRYRREPTLMGSRYKSVPVSAERRDGAAFRHPGPVSVDR
jgi:hypothetical protein